MSLNSPKTEVDITPEMVSTITRQVGMNTVFTTKDLCVASGPRQMLCNWHRASRNAGIVGGIV
jgi:hypothetical protein